VLRVGDRQGTILPAWKTSGGKALLAELPDAQLTTLLRGANGRPPEGMTAAERRSLVNELRLVRDQGYAENIQESESGVCAIGLWRQGKVRRPAGRPVGLRPLGPLHLRPLPRLSPRAQVDGGEGPGGHLALALRR